jgi:hypothetical protein
MFYGAKTGYIQSIWHDDVSMITGVIGLLIIAVMIVAGQKTWNLNEETSSALCTFCTGLSTMLGLFGTTTGFRLMSGGSVEAVAQAIPTIVVTTWAGVLGSIVMGILTFNLEMGIRASKEHW